MNLRKIIVSNDNTHHLFDEKPLYAKKFKHVLKFHPPGLAPVLDETGAYHIKTDGSPAYDQRYIKTLGFYFEKAAVITDKGWGHINIDGSFVYKPIFDWVGNYQDSICTVRDKDGNYFHIEIEGKRIYSENMIYAGDFRDGVAVVRRRNGLCVHINKRGGLIHSKQFRDLDVFHKGFSRARDENGWFHINKSGEEAYSHRYYSVEPFYNGYAFVEDFDGKRLIIDEKGKTVHIVLEKLLDSEIQDSNNHLAKHDLSLFDEISASLVRFWESQTIYAAVKLGVFESIEDEGSIIQELKEQCKISEEGTLRLIRALCSIGLLKYENYKIRITKKGSFLKKSHDLSLSYAALMWNEEHYDILRKTYFSVKEGKEVFSEKYGKSFFEWIEENPEKSKLYHSAMKSYALRDYTQIPEIYNFSNHKVILDVGGGSGILLKQILDKYPDMKGMLFERKGVIDMARKTTLKNFKDRCSFFSGSFFNNIPKGADAIFLSRILHDWDDENATKILQNCNKALDKEQKLYIIELLLPKDFNDPLGGLLNLNMLTLTSGKERTLEEYSKLLEKSGFSLDEILETRSVNSLLIASKI